MALNNAAQPAVNALDAAALTELAGWSHVSLVAAAEGDVAGALIALPPGLPYGSTNYRWFSERYAAFIYIDRVVVAGERRGCGVGRRLYEGLFAALADLDPLPRLVCEVNVDPPNLRSRRFHARLGFSEVGHVSRLAPGKSVVMLAR